MVDARWSGKLKQEVQSVVVIPTVLPGGKSRNDEQGIADPLAQALDVVRPADEHFGPREELIQGRGSADDGAEEAH